jgi:hypothetical protein
MGSAWTLTYTVSTIWVDSPPMASEIKGVSFEIKGVSFD